MNAKVASSVVLAVFAGVFGGCISHEETIYKDVDRVKVEFESDRAARSFYEALGEQRGHGRRHETTTRVDIPIVFDHKQRVVTGDNWLFNEGVLRADTNKDGKITEMEARIYREQALRK